MSLKDRRKLVNLDGVAAGKSTFAQVAIDLIAVGTEVALGPRTDPGVRLSRTGLLP